MFLFLPKSSVIDLANGLKSHVRLFLLKTACWEILGRPKTPANDSPPSPRRVVWVWKFRTLPKSFISVTLDITAPKPWRFLHAVSLPFTRFHKHTG